MNRKAVAKETLDILKKGFYLWNGKKVEIESIHKNSIENSRYIAPEETFEKTKETRSESVCTILVSPYQTVRAILDAVHAKKEAIAVLNFASAKNPGGGFLNGAMAQEESLAASSGLYDTLTAHWEYYEKNRNTASMIYTDGAIYSKDVVFFRDESFQLLETPVLASVLTLPAVNYGQVLLKGEDSKLAKQRMRARMERSLQIFKKEGAKNLILGAYGCGVFRNDPKDIAKWWKELLEEGYKNDFESICFAIFDRSEQQTCFRAFHIFSEMN